MHQDFKELLFAFNAEQVRYLIVGGYAVSFHAQPRATKDLDILIGADAENSRAVYAALAKFGAPWSRRVDVQIDDDLSVSFISREDLLVAKLSAGRAQDLIDVDALRESNQSQDSEQQQRPASPVANAQNELEQIRREGREDWLKHREQDGLSPTVEEMRAKGRENWLELRHKQTRENSGDLQDRSAEKDQDAKPIHDSGSPERGLDDDLN
jgi:hypothetical protein